jgi:hypothetical protein
MRHDATFNPGRETSAATKASPKGSVGMLSRSVFGDTNSTLMQPSYPGGGVLSSRTMPCLAWRKPRQHTNTGSMTTNRGVAGRGPAGTRRFIATLL